MTHGTKNRISRSFTILIFLLLLTIGVVSYSRLVESGEAANVTLTRNKTTDDSSYATTTTELVNRGYSKASIAQVGQDLNKTMANDCPLPAWAGVTTEKLPIARTICWPNTEINPAQPPYWRVQGIGGNNSAIDGGGMSHDNFLLIGLVRQPAEDTAKMQLIDTSTSPVTYQDINLINTCSSSSCPLTLDIHVGGIAWTGRWVYAASTSGIHVFDTQAIYKSSSDGKYYWPKYGKWTLSQTTVCSGVESPRISTLATDTSANQLIAAEYVSGSTDCGGSNKTNIMWWNLASDGSLDSVTTNPGGNTVKTATSVRVFSFDTGDPKHINGVAAHQGIVYLNDTYQTISSVSDLEVQYKYDSSTFTREKTLLMPATNPEGIYLNRCSNTFWTGNEGNGTMQNTFLYSYSLASISPESSTETLCKFAVTLPPSPDPDPTPNPTPDPTTDPDPTPNPTPDPEPESPIIGSNTDSNDPSYSVVVKDSSGQVLSNTTVIVNGTEYQTNDEGRIVLKDDPESSPIRVTTTDGKALQLTDKKTLPPAREVNGAQAMKANRVAVPVTITIFMTAGGALALFLRYKGI